MSLLSQLSRKARISLAATVAGGVVLTGVTIGPSFATAPSESKPTTSQSSAEIGAQADSVTREEMLRRAKVWLTANNGSQVPYSQTSVWTDGYRQDCSGYVSMTLGLWKSGPNTVELASNRDLTTPISLGDLKPGDLLIDAEGSNTTRHVVIFEGWTDSSKTAYTAYEQRGGHGTDHRTVKYGLGGDEYEPYRPVNLTDGGDPGDPPPENPAPSYPSLKNGSSGADVTTAQYLLTGHGHSTARDGAYGPRTTAAAKAFQGANGLVTDGVIGPKTWAKLVSPVRQGADGDVVRAAQTQLNVYGHGLRVDGEFGPATDAAVKAFQKQHGLTVDGLVGPKTWVALVGTK